MTDEARELHRIIRASVRDMLDAYRIQAQTGPVSEEGLQVEDTLHGSDEAQAATIG